MGISVSAGTAVILVGLFVALGVIVPGSLNAFERVLAADDARDDLQLDRKHVEVAVLNTTLDGQNLTATVVNDGVVTLSLSETTLLVDNSYQDVVDSTVTGDNETDLWQPGEVANFTVHVDDPESVVVATSVGVRDRAAIGGES